MATLGDAQRSLRLSGKADEMLSRGRIAGSQGHLERDRVVAGSGRRLQGSLGVVATLLPAIGVGLVNQGAQ